MINLKLVNPVPTPIYCAHLTPFPSFILHPRPPKILHESTYPRLILDNLSRIYLGKSWVCSPTIIVHICESSMIVKMTASNFFFQIFRFVNALSRGFESVDDAYYVI